MSLSDKVIWLVAAVILVPVLLSPAGWAFGLALAVAWVVAAYLSIYLLSLEKHRREGERGLASQARQSYGRDE